MQLIMIALFVASLLVGQNIEASAPQDVELTKEQAVVMSPAALGDRLLPAGDPKIVKAVIHPSGMDAPWASLTSVELYSVAAPDGQGFCKGKAFRLGFQPADPTKNPVMVSVPMRVASREARSIYRLADRTGAKPVVCDPSRQIFFTSANVVEASMQTRALRVLAQAVEGSRNGRPPKFDYKFDDRMPTDMPRLSGGEALAALPLSDAFAVRVLRETDDPWSFRRDEAKPEPGAQRVEILMGIFNAYMVFTGDVIEHLVIRRQIPPPF